MIKNCLRRIGIFFIISISFFYILNINTYVYASNSVGSSAINRYKTEINKVDTGKDSPSKSISNFEGSIIFILQLFFQGLAVVMLMVLAIKYMVSSVEEKAEIKKHLALYIFGVVLLFAASGLVALLKQFFIGISK